MAELVFFSIVFTRPLKFSPNITIEIYCFHGCYGCYVRVNFDANARQKIHGSTDRPTLKACLGRKRKYISDARLMVKNGFFTVVSKMKKV